MKTLFLICILLILNSCGNNSKVKQEELQNKKSLEDKINNSSAKNETSKHQTFNQSIDTLSEVIQGFIPKGYSAINLSTGDANLDGVSDKILVLRKESEETTSNYSDGKQDKRPFLLLLGQENNSYKLAVRNDNAVYCIDCGGMFGDPFVGTTIKNGYFSIEHGIAGGQHWEQVITFKFDKKLNNWFLYKDHFINYKLNESNNPNAEALVKDVDKLETKKEFGSITIDEFNIYNEDGN